MKIGIIGDGQLGQMLALAAIPLGHRVHFLGQDKTGPAASVGPVFDAADPAARHAFHAASDLITAETEHVDGRLEQQWPVAKPIHPSWRAFALAQDRTHEKAFFDDLGLPVAPYRPIEDKAMLRQAIDALGLPLLLKTARGGYDGKGQQWLRHLNELDSAWSAMAAHAPLVAEAAVPFQRELSVIGVRSRTGEIRCYPLSENQHRDGILRVSIAPAPNSMAQAERAQHYLRTVMQALNYVGALTLELFELADGTLLINEMATRVHNSGHWTLNGDVCSQFENHIRAITGAPLGDTEPTGHHAMINFIGETVDAAFWQSQPRCRFYWYGKAARSGRKLGHVVISEPSPERLAERLAELNKPATENANLLRVS